MSFFKNIIDKFGFGSGEETQAQTAGKVLIDHNYLENLEESLIKSDLGVDLSLEYSQILESKYIDKEVDENVLAQELKDFLLQAFTGEQVKLELNKDLKNIFLIVGVNGVGKTTSIGKLANKYRKDGFKTVIAAGDTFRAAAEAQLELWSKRAQVDIIQLEDGAKPSTVVFKAIEKIKAEKHNALLIDTAGRLQNKKDLMQELKKLKEVIVKNLEGENYQLKTMLVLDATTGSNAISQAQSFNEVTELDGIILTKFDGSARAGVVFSLAKKFHLPVFYIGTGEGIDDISDFDLDQFLAKYL